MNILVTINTNYYRPLRTMLYSLFRVHTHDQLTIWLLYAELEETKRQELVAWTARAGHILKPIFVGTDMFADAPVLLHYTKEMYFRLLAWKLLPQTLDRVLYLDPDLLILNRLDTLYQMDLGTCWFAAAHHNKLAINEINRLRLYPYDIENYHNSGVLLMDLAALRHSADEQDIYQFVDENRNKLVMPDQDILNALYAKRIQSIDEMHWNYDARYYSIGKRLIDERYDMRELMSHTAILHFCGKRKPWLKNYYGVFLGLWHYFDYLANKDLVFEGVSR